ncbi:MAG: hypothetical protein D6679_06520 [Candidatus Hydrogenedentota bacterium]|nr:MAG: hypothetical protein D6679_06520 [Candidatus Hydrogenedentota bacterium]
MRTPAGTMRNLFSAYVSVVLGFGLSAYGLAPFPAPPPRSPALGLVIAVAFTATHAVLPIFVFYGVETVINLAGLCISLFESKKRGEAEGAVEDVAEKMAVILKVFRVVLYLFLGSWFILPIIGFARVLGGIAGAGFIIGAIIHVVASGKEKAAWTVMQYGSTAIALLLFAWQVNRVGLSPGWLIAAAILQGALLTIAEVAFRPEVNAIVEKRVKKSLLDCVPKVDS